VTAREPCGGFDPARGRLPGAVAHALFSGDDWLDAPDPTKLRPTKQRLEAEQEPRYLVSPEPRERAVEIFYIPTIVVENQFGITF